MNEISKKVAALFTKYAGEKVFSWNLTQYTALPDEQVGFVLKRPNFHGVVNIAELPNNVFAVAFRGIDWEETGVAYLYTEQDMVSFVGNLGAGVKGERAPQDMAMPKAA